MLLIIAVKRIKRKSILIFPDEEEQLQPITLTRQHKGAIRAIRKVRGKNVLFVLNSIIAKNTTVANINCLDTIFGIPAQIQGGVKAL